MSAACRRRLAGACLLLCAAAVAAAAQRVSVLEDADLGPWEPQSFKGRTRYEPVQTPAGRVLRARSEGSASGLVRRLHVDLRETPVLHWRWRVENVLEGVQETRKSGDDYPARVYVVVSGGALFWRTRAVNYVWASREPRGTTWPNAFTDHARMVAVESGTGRVGRWVEESRDVRADFRRLFGEEVDSIDAVAIMTDTDNSGQRATAFYGDIWFAPQ